MSADNEVRDLPAERGIIISNFMGACALALMGWMALNLEDIKKNISIFKADIAVLKIEVKHNTQAIEEHEKDHNVFCTVKEK